MKKKDKGIAILMVFLLGSLGVFYASAKWGLITTFLFPIIEVVLIFGFYALSPESGILSIFALAIIHIGVCVGIVVDEVNNHNRAVDRLKLNSLHKRDVKQLIISTK